ncbi:hypothetical protein GCM10008015_17770 [Flavobacterium palustre]|uniref:Uncharacterized protein n=1 Tax=Flavobacterium palustre TaxID=1476463 RepID=A0ABQ1HI56_9FLAO|nr:hypothetical protein [Flavobacterium palustre]GGA77514.1 hypothetical protein GCM10008015_17770 [Flavobacterium palustre]
MNGLLKETSEIEKLQEEFKILTQIKQKKAATTKNEQEELILEECEL